MIFLTGDLHGSKNLLDRIKSFESNNKDLTKDDFLIFLGDFGIPWEFPINKQDSYWIDWLKDRNFTTLVVDGNHENHFYLNQLPLENRFGNPVGIIADSIYHLKRSYVYSIKDINFFVCGGALSIDKDLRILNVSYWKEELLNYIETERGFKEISNCNRIDYVLTHTAPTDVVDYAVDHFFSSIYNSIKDPTNSYLKQICERIDFKTWFFGHFHINSPNFKIQNKEFKCLFDEIVKIDSVV